MKTITPILIFGIVFTILVLWFFGKTAKPIKGIDGPIEYVFFTKTSTKVAVEIANTEAKRAKGLMFRTHLQEDRGMLFIFQTSASHAFWMANTKIPLDILWINEDLKIVDISKNTPPCTETGTLTSLCKAYAPREKAKYVLEVNGGYTDKNSIVIGDYVSF
ncbi:MAG: hypothetical protein RLY61_279 [Candidatus Parcubacteria bacterium]|jgi:uncharacterized membrane protein (UPF0127 family)